MTEKDKDLTDPLAIEEKREFASPVRTRRPEYIDLLPPCNNRCPAGEDIQGWLSLVQDEKYEDAWQHLLRDNPMPAIHGRVCYHPCEDACNRKEVDSSVSIHAVERFLGDKALADGWRPKIEAPSSGKRILIVGSGPSGLSAAYHLARLGHQVEIYEAGPKAGGMMRNGIPAYRLPREILDQEIDRIASMGVKITVDRKVEDLAEEKRKGGFDAVFVAIGAQLNKRVNIPTSDATKIMGAIDYLKESGGEKAPILGKRVAIYGGGNTAMDAARVAQRMGVEDAMIIYRRDRDHMPAHDSEAEDAIDEGINIHWLRNIKEFKDDEITVEIMELGEDGRPKGTGKFESLKADTLIMAVGQDCDTGFLRKVDGVDFNDDGTVKVDDTLMTGSKGVFAGGDVLPYERSVTVAVGHGKKAARNIDSFLKNETYASPPKGDLAAYDKLKLWLYTDATQSQQESLGLAERKKGFAEVLQGIDQKTALYESGRCFSCGNCFECDGCLGACPEKAVIKLGKGKRYRFDYQKCTGCAVCFEQCPCHAIEMVAET